MGVPTAERRKEIIKLLPGVLDSLTTHMVELGVGFDHAAALLVKGSDNELSRAFDGYLQEVREGIEAGETVGLRRRALLDVARRIDVPEVTTFVNAVIQADQLGVKIADILGALSLRMAALNEIEADFENMRAAWTWAVERKNYEAIDRAIETLYWFCHSRRRYREAEALFGLAGKQLAPQPGEEPHPVWAKIIARYPDPDEDRVAQIKRSLAIARKRDDRAEIAFCLYALGNMATRASVPSPLAPPVLPGERDFDAGIAYYEQSLAHYRDLGDKFYIAELLGRIGWCYQAIGQQDHAVDFARQSLDLSREIGDQPARGWFPFMPSRDDDI
jgi:tetratricopeptide (TPR) repeat protein